MPATPSDRHLPTIRPLTARSVVLSTLLGLRPPELSARALVRAGALFDVAEPTVRVALARMTADGDLAAEGGVYRLADRLVRRQQRQEELRAPWTVPWDGTWEMAVVDAPARSVADRTTRRRHLLGLRLAELREGVWVRPANLARSLDDRVEECVVFRGRPAEPAVLAERLWDLPAWAATARDLHDELGTTTAMRDLFLLVARCVRHLQVDPVLPAALLPADWPGLDLRSRYSEVHDAYAARLREYLGSA